MRQVMSREDARRQAVMHSVGVLEAEGLVLYAEVMALREVAGEAPAGNLEAAAMLEEAQAIDRQRQVKVLALAHLQRMVGDLSPVAAGATPQNAPGGPQKPADRPEAAQPADPSQNALRAFLSALRAALVRAPDQRDAHDRPLTLLVNALGQAQDDAARAELLISAGIPTLAQILAPAVVRGYATILGQLMPGWDEVRAALTDVAAACKADVEAPTAAALQALMAGSGVLAPAETISSGSARAALGVLQGLAYPAGRPQQLAQATLRVIAIRTALADAIAELGAA